MKLIKKKNTKEKIGVKEMSLPIIYMKDLADTDSKFKVVQFTGTCTPIFISNDYDACIDFMYEFLSMDSTARMLFLMREKGIIPMREHNIQTVNLIEQGKEHWEYERKEVQEEFFSKYTDLYEPIDYDELFKSTRLARNVMAKELREDIIRSNEEKKNIEMLYGVSNMEDENEKTSGEKVELSEAFSSIVSNTKKIKLPLPKKAKKKNKVVLRKKVIK